MVFFRAFYQLMFLFLNLNSFVVYAYDLEVYGEHASWFFDRSEDARQTSYEDSSFLRLRLHALQNSTLTRPYASLSVQRDSAGSPVGYERKTVSGGFGVWRRFEKIPLSLYVEGRRLWQAKSTSSVTVARNEVAALGVVQNNWGGHDHDDLRLSCYGDLTYRVRENESSTLFGSAWIRLRAVSLGSKGFHFDLDPIDTAYYGECVDGCAQWVFVGIGLGARYAYQSMTLSLRGNLGERFDFLREARAKSHDTARILLGISGGAWHD